MPDKMNPEIKAKWVEALRSGKYDQAEGRLRGADNDFCCLGVLCDLHSKLTLGLSWKRIAISGGEVLGYKYDDDETSLPVPVLTWAGFDVDDGNANDPIVEDHALSYHNDSGKTFAQIADLIEANL